MRCMWVFLLMIPGMAAEGVSPPPAVVADSLSRQPLANASVFDRSGRFMGVSRPDGRVPVAGASDYPLTIRYMGFRERVVPDAGSDTIWMEESFAQLPEVVVESRQKKMLHILAYVREYSTLSTFTDTVAMFREKMVDFMLPVEAKTRYRGWRVPRVINSRSYYRFTNAEGLDSVSDRCNHHFTWSDWVGILPGITLPSGLCGKENGTYTVRGRYSPTEEWVKNGDRVMLDVNVLADTTSRKWVPNLSLFFRQGDVEFEQFRLRLN
ncbi:MAG: carboxypeptidase-like regulatory domain-containing protein, partial [Muribaculaceae bacterium]|nr:carboxypeptidase-like regulatory domain-containing protein [Muribaculaceae bacterium]